jgi:glycerol-3-phosphate dehydrogenase (NAD(P)+)
VAVLGAGSWGTALAIHLGRAGVPVRLWARDRALADATRAARENARYLPGLVLPDAVTVTADASAALAGVGTVLIAVPSHFVETVLTRVADHVVPRAVLVSATKGLEPRRGLRISLLLAERLPGRVVAVLSGPSFAREVAQGRRPWWWRARTRRSRRISSAGWPGRPCGSTPTATCSASSSAARSRT